jgi:hypothetical protein
MGATKRPQYSEALKRQMAEETLAPGGGVVGPRHYVNSNPIVQ